MASDSVTDPPLCEMDDGPIIGASGPGVALTVTIVAVVHPLVAVKVITEVPGAMPVIAPDAVAVATV